MPKLHLLGDIQFTMGCDTAGLISLTWAVVTGNDEWRLIEGSSGGETHSSSVCDITGKAIINHPIDIHYDSPTTEGWPTFVCELWEKYDNGIRGFIGCGSMWIPSIAGKHCIDIQLWKPRSKGLDQLEDQFLPSYPDLHSLRELNLNPFLRSQVQVDNVGIVQLQVYTVTAGFEHSLGVVFK